MCGIAGAWNFGRKDGAYEILPAQVAAMIDRLSHRGPDHQQIWSDERIALGHARLSIIDLSPDGYQPMATSDCEIHMVCNGEIYNFRELRSELEAAGHCFLSCSDSEVILHGYRQWGVDVFRRLRGMFAVALWDAPQRCLVLARDGIGKKPLYYHYGPAGLAFASEIKALLVLPWVPRRPDMTAIHDYLSFQHTLCPATAFEDIHRVPQGHFMVISDDRLPRSQPFWFLPPPAQAQARSIDVLKEEIIALLDAAVKARMVSDVPVGALLSGGVDSSAVVAFMAKASGQPVKTFSIGFAETEYDERHFARLVAERFGTDHHELVLDQLNCRDVLGQLAWHYGEPFADPSAIATYHVCALARRQVSVVLTGDGGDESFLGYNRYLTPLDWPSMSRLPYWVKAGLRTAAAHLPAFLGASRAGLKLRHITTRQTGTPAEFYAPSIHYFLENEKRDAYGDALRPQLIRSTLKHIEPYFEGGHSHMAGAAWADLHTYLPDNLLVKVDVASMAHGLEARSPLLDQNILEWAAAIPAEQKIWGRETKALFKSALEPVLPHSILYRPKMGFGVPVDRWLRGPWRDLAYDLLLSPRFLERGLIRRPWVEWALDAHCSGKLYFWHRIWALMMLELWYRTWIDECLQQPLTV